MATRCESFYPTEDDVRRYRASTLRRTGTRLSPDEAHAHLLRWRRFVWEHRPQVAERLFHD